MSVFYRTNEMRIVQFLTEAEEIYYDESFQRPADVFYGINSTPIVVAEIENAADMLKKDMMKHPKLILQSIQKEA